MTKKRGDLRFLEIGLNMGDWETSILLEDQQMSGFLKWLLLHTWDDAVRTNVTAHNSSPLCDCPAMMGSVCVFFVDQINAEEEVTLVPILRTNLKNQSLNSDLKTLKQRLSGFPCLGVCLYVV